MSQRSGYILVLDDDIGILTLQRRALERAGNTVVAVSDIGAAMAAVQNSPPNLLVLDYQLGTGATGLDFYNRLRAEGVDLPAILVTGFSDERKIIEAIRAGIRDVVPKGGEYLDYLPQAVDRVLGQVRAEEEAREAEALRRSEQQQRRTAEQYRLALEAGKLGTWDYDLVNRRMFLDERFRSIFGVTGEVWEYEQVLALVHPDDRRRVGNAIREANDPVVARPYEIEHRVVWPDGSCHWVIAKGSVHFEGEDANRRPVRFLGTVMDVTPRRLAEDELRRAKAAAEQASRAKDHFLAVLSHELRTPLTPVLAVASMLQEDGSLNHDMRESLEMIRRNVELEARLIDDLLDVTRISRGKVELDLHSVELATVIHRAVEVCRGDLEAKHLHLSIDLGPSPCMVRADPARLQQVFWNLIKNAIKFTPNGGEVHVRCCQGLSGCVVTEVADTGVGIEPDALPRIFDAFEQAERTIARRFGGLGLGLTISRHLVELHGGSIEARSDGKGKGATFRVALPCITAAQPAVAPDSTASGAAQVDAKAKPGRPLNILLVEDHRDTAKAMKRLLMADGHQVQTAGAVAAALEAASEFPFDLLVSDVGLPDGTGLDLIRALRERGVSQPAIALSGFGQDEDIRRSIDAGFAVHLTKPVDVHRLEATIHSLMG